MRFLDLKNGLHKSKQQIFFHTFLKKKKMTYINIASIIKTGRSNERYLSNFLKTKYGANFSTYINSFRIEESKKLLLSKENDNFTIETIANMAGFHSKLPFNIAFKATMGFTPSEFRKNHISSEIG